MDGYEYRGKFEFLTTENTESTEIFGQTFAGTRIFPAKAPRRKDFWKRDAVFTGTPVEIRENSRLKTFFNFH